MQLEAYWKPPCLPSPPAYLSCSLLLLPLRQVRRACEELLDMVASWPRENTDEVELDASASAAFRSDCSQRMYQVGLRLDMLLMLLSFSCCYGAHCMFHISSAGGLT